MKKQERINRVIARGEGSNHSHVITGDATITRNKDSEILIAQQEYDPYNDLIQQVRD